MSACDIIQWHAGLRLGQSGQPNISRSALVPEIKTNKQRDGPREFTIQVAESAALVTIICTVCLAVTAALKPFGQDTSVPALSD
jgi:hypothetical protein